MSCDAAALALSLHLAAVRADAAGPILLRIASAPPPRPVSALSREPLFASIVGSAGQLRDRVDGLRRRGADAAAVAALDPQVAALSALDMQGHLALAQRGTDGDLKCILRGISQDLTRKFASLRAASDPAGRRSALDEFWYLLRDNVEVVTTPAAVQSSETVAGAA